jgi:diketogulonate reductase-like aldo/keto reductase
VKIPIKKLNSGFEMPVFGLGTWGMGGRYFRDPFNNDKADIIAIREAVKSGISHIDTAEMYAGGHAEELVGKAIADFDREKLFLVSKVSPEHFRFDDVKRSCEKSLKRLEVGYLDLYLLHHPNHSIPIKETMKAMNELLDQGLVKNIGVSNFNKESFDEAQAVSKNKIAANQVHYNLRVREAEISGLVAHHRKNDVMLIAWRPIEKGMLAKDDSGVLEEIAAKYKKTRIQVAINWLILQENVVTLSKSTSPEHLRENLGAVGWQMEKADAEKLKEKFEDQIAVSDVVPLG